MIEIHPYSPDWPIAFACENGRLSPLFSTIEHVGSTSVPNLAAKPVIDIMAACDDVDLANERALAVLVPLGYSHIQTGMRGRHLLQNACGLGGLPVNLHLVPVVGWDRQPERLFRDALLQSEAEVHAYAALKSKLAQDFSKDLLGYTKAKTDFIQRVIDNVTAAKGWPKIHVWQD